MYEGLQGFWKIIKRGDQNKRGGGGNKRDENKIILKHFINFAQHRYF